MKNLAEGDCLICGDKLNGIVCHNCSAHQGTEFLESLMEGGKCEKCQAWKSSCKCQKKVTRKQRLKVLFSGYSITVLR